MKKLLSIITAATGLTLALFLMSGCGSATADLASLRDANTITSLADDHTSICESVQYYENLDDQVTFTTSYCYSQEGGGQTIYGAEGYDTVDESSEDNFSYCIVENVEYYMDYTGAMTIYPLPAQYLEDFKDDSFTVSVSDSENLKSVKKNGLDMIFTSLTSASQLYTQETLDHLSQLSGSEIVTIKKVSTANRNTLELSSVDTYYVCEDGSEYLYSSETVTYDETKPDLEYAEAYINPSTVRSVTVIEETDAGDVSNVYSLPAFETVNFQCFTQYYGYSVYNDASGYDPFNGEYPDAGGNYSNVTYYAIPALDPSISEDEITEAG